MGATTVYVEGSPVASWNADTKSAVTSNNTVLQTFNADTKADVDNVYTKTETDTLLSNYVTKTTEQEISGAKTFTGDNTFRTSGATYGAKIPNTTAWTANQTLATLDMIYPVNSVYISVGSTDPHDLFGGTWVNILSNGSITGGSISISANGSFNVKGETTGAVASFKYSAVTGAGDSTQTYFYGRSGSSNGYETLKYSSGLSATNETVISGIYMWKRTA